jgi:hypothetical protein|tara:strand:- start:251 stop:424 length:174 start_codon:yes stop_codon:yes gene_type:complete
MTFDPSQESMEEYLRRIHLKDKINEEWNYDEEKEKEKLYRLRSICWTGFRKLRQTSD